MRKGIAVILALIAVAVLLVGLVVFFRADATTTSPTTSPTTPATTPASSPTSGAIPGDMLNPAVTQATISTTICTPGYTARIRPASLTQLKRAQIAAYGYQDTALVSYEEDHVVSLELGGSADSKSNLFPEPIVWAKSDDQQENALHAAVCSGARILADAQAAILALKTSHGYRRASSVA